MALNEMIAQGAQFKMPDPLEQYGRIAQIQQAQNQNALAQYQINSAKRADETNTNFLSSLRAAGDDPVAVRRALMMAGKVKEAGEFDASALTRQKTQGEIQEQQRKNVDRMKLDLSNNPSDENIKAFMQDVDLDPTFSAAAKAIAKRGLGEMLGMSVEERRKSLATTGMTGAERATAGLAEKKFLAPEPLEIARADGSKIFMDKNPNSPTFKQEILPAQAAGMTPYQTGNLKVAQQQLGVSQGNQRLAQEKFNWEKANPGYSVQESSAGLVAVNLKNPQDVRPINIGGQPIGPKPIFNAQSGGFITPPVAGGQPGFVPIPEIQQQKDQQAAVKALKSAGYDPVTGEDTISKLIEKSTSGRAQAGTAATLAFLGVTTDGRKAIAALEGTANQIATDLAGGKLGAGISNTDREFIVAALGDVANANKTSEERLAGWTAAKNRMIATGLVPTPGRPAAAPARTQSGATTSNW